MESNNKCPFTIGGQIWFQKNNDVFMVDQTVELIDQVNQLGSISQAAKAVNISYQKAWTLIDKANKNSRLPLVIPKRGGNAGGGAAVTAQGKKLLERFNELQKRFDEFIINNLHLLET